MTRTGDPSPVHDAVTPAEAARFAASLGRLLPEGGRVGLAVSGGSDSTAMLLLAQAAIPGEFEVATVDHGLRPEAAQEAAFVAAICAERGIAHETLAVNVAPGNVQDAARTARYTALADWTRRKGLAAIATAHHADDQAETLLMRLGRASGLAGLAGVRERGLAPGSNVALVRPVLLWRRDELAAIVARAGIDPVSDPSNADPRFDRARLRLAIADAEWLDPAALAQSAGHLADANEALDWATEQDWYTHVSIASGGIEYRPGAPRAIALRVVARIISGFGGNPRGSEVARLIDTLGEGNSGTLGGVIARVEDGAWTFRPEPPRRSGGAA